MIIPLMIYIFFVAEAVTFKSVLSVDVYFQINIIVRLLLGSSGFFRVRSGVMQVLIDLEMNFWHVKYNFVKSSSSFTFVPRGKKFPGSYGVICGHFMLSEC